jgi:CubicO group peptidase (beta-lactamase class C family)
MQLWAQTTPVFTLTDDDIRTILRDRVDRRQAVGIVVGMIDQNGSRVIAYGKPSKDSNRTVDGDTVFEIGSVTKTFTATLLADMVDRGEVSLNDPISKYLPASVKTPVRNGREITLLDLATHASGLPRDPQCLNFLCTNLWGFVFSGQTFLRQVLSTDRMYGFLSRYELKRDIGAQFEYSNYGLGLLGQVLALRAGTDYESLLRARVLDPLEMHDTRVLPTPEMKSRLARGHDSARIRIGVGTFSRGGNPTKPMPTVTLDGWYAAAGGLHSTANDLLKYIAANLRLRPSPLLSAMNLAHQAERDLDEPHWGKNLIGLSWFISKKYDPELLHHDGSFYGYRSFVGMDAKNRRGVVILWNAESDMDDIGLHLLDTRYAIYKEHHAIPLDPKIFDTYAGEYRPLPPSLSLTVSRQGKRFFAQWTGREKWEILPETVTRFFAKASGSEVAFGRDDMNRLTVTVSTGGLGLDFSAPKVQ